MDDKKQALQNHLELAARNAIDVGGGDSLATIGAFRDQVEVALALPTEWLPGEPARFHDMIRRLSDKEVATIGVPTFDYPAVVALGRSPKVTSFGCSGVLISRDILLTTGHCLAEGFYGGAWTYDGTQPEPLNLSDNRLRHENWGQPKAFQNDIGLIQLKDPVDINVEIYPIADSATIDAASTFRIVGYGNDLNGNHGADFKNTTEVRIRMNPSDGTIGFKDKEFIIGDQLNDNYGDACESDSGGPVLIKVNDRYELAGIISRPVDPEQAICGNGSICIRLDRYTDWIDKAIDALGGQDRPSL